MNKKTFSIPYAWIRWGAILYITLPIFCFFIGWMKWYWAVTGCVALMVCLFFFGEKPPAIFRKKVEKSSLEAEKEKEMLILPKWMPFAIVGISFAYSFFCGIGRLWAQSKDYPWRNAVFRDLILRDWPVLYDRYKGAMSYYISLWIPPSLVGKLAYKLGADADGAFFAGNIALLIYVTIGLSVLFLILISYFKPKKWNAMLLVVLGFIFFSGMDIVACIEPLGANNYHLEWWAEKYQYSSFTTCMCWVFNQAVIPWICMALLIKEKNIKNYVFIGMACLFSGPFPFVGFFIYCIAKGIADFIKAGKSKSIGRYVKELFSISNLVAAIFIFPFIGAFLLSNSILTLHSGVGLSYAVTDVASSAETTVFSEETSDSGFSEETPDSGSSETTEYVDPHPAATAVWRYVKFILLEFGIYAILIAWKQRKNYLFYVTIVQLLLFPFFRIGFSSDFTMRASIPAIFMMYVLCYEFVLQEKENCLKKADAKGNANKGDAKNFDVQTLKRYGYIILVVCLVLGAATPSVEFIRGFRQVSMRGIDDPITDFLYTLGGDGPYSHNNIDTPEYNFVALELNQTIFFGHFARMK